MGQGVTGDVLDVLATGPDDGPVGHDDLERQDRIARLAVFHATQAARVRAEVAPDRTRLIARGVRRVEETLRRDRGLEVGIDDARLDDRDKVFPIDLQDPIHGREGDRQAAFDAGRTTRQPGAGPAWDDGNTKVRSDPYQFGHVGGRRREDDGTGQTGAKVGGLVEPIGLAVDGIRQQSQPGQTGPDGGHQGGGVGAHFGLGGHAPQSTREAAGRPRGDLIDVCADQLRPSADPRRAPWTSGGTTRAARGTKHASRRPARPR